MTEAEWNLINGTLVHLKQSVDNCESCHLDMDYTFIKEIVENNKPFEVEVGKEYVARFITCFTDQEEYGSSVFYDEGEVALVKEVKEHYVCLEIKGVLGYTHTVYKPTEEFKASFKPLENDKN